VLLQQSIEIQHGVDVRDARTLWDGADRPVVLKRVRIPIRHAPLHPRTPVRTHIRACPKAAARLGQVLRVVPHRRDPSRQAVLVDDELPAKTFRRALSVRCQPHASFLITTVVRANETHSRANGMHTLPPKKGFVERTLYSGRRRSSGAVTIGPPSSRR